MAAPNITAFLHTFVFGNAYSFRLEGTGLDTVTSATFSDTSLGSNWSQYSNPTFDGTYLIVTGLLPLQPAPPSSPTGFPETATGGDGSLTIVVNAPGGSSNPMIIPTFYTTSS